MLHRHGKEQSNPHAILLESLIKEWYVTSGNVKRFPRLIPRRVERDLHRLVPVHRRERLERGRLRPERRQQRRRRLAKPAEIIINLDEDKKNTSDTLPVPE